MQRNFFKTELKFTQFDFRYDQQIFQQAIQALCLLQTDINKSFRIIIINGCSCFNRFQITNNCCERSSDFMREAVNFLKISLD